MNYQKKLPDFLLPYFEGIHDIDYYAFPVLFGSTAGPNEMAIGSQAITTFTVEAYTSHQLKLTAYVCGSFFDVQEGAIELPIEMKKFNWKRFKKGLDRQANSL